MESEITKEQDNEWFVLRVTYQRELLAKEQFDALDIPNFV